MFNSVPPCFYMYNIFEVIVEPRVSSLHLGVPPGIGSVGSVGLLELVPRMWNAS